MSENFRIMHENQELRNEIASLTQSAKDLRKRNRFLVSQNDGLSKHIKTLIRKGFAFKSLWPTEEELNSETRTEFENMSKEELDKILYRVFEPVEIGHEL